MYYLQNKSEPIACFLWNKNNNYKTPLLINFEKNYVFDFQILLVKFIDTNNESTSTRVF